MPQHTTPEWIYAVRRARCFALPVNIERDYRETAPRFYRAAISNELEAKYVRILTAHREAIIERRNSDLANAIAHAQRMYKRYGKSAPDGIWELSEIGL